MSQEIKNLRNKSISGSLNANQVADIENSAIEYLQLRQLDTNNNVSLHNFIDIAITHYRRSNNTQAI